MVAHPRAEGERNKKLRAPNGFPERALEVYSLLILHLASMARPTYNTDGAEIEPCKAYKWS